MRIDDKYKMKIAQLEQFDKHMIEQVAAIHMETFQGFFLTFMGKGFLKQMYRSYCTHEESGLLGAFDEENHLVGFLAYSADLSGLYKYMIKKTPDSLCVVCLWCLFAQAESFYETCTCVSETWRE